MMSRTYREPINALDLALQPLERIEFSVKRADGTSSWRPSSALLGVADPRELVNEWAKDERITRFRIIIGDEVGE